MLEYDLTTDRDVTLSQRPSLLELFAHSTEGERYPVVFSFQRQDRQYPGLVIIRGQDGRFIRNANGSLFQVSQIALSVSNLPGYITNGNSPQGVYSILGLGTSDNVFIGPTPFFHSVLPFEVDVRRFFHHSQRGQEKWTLERYWELWPEGWQDYFPVREAWYAGKAGRGEIIAHGTTISPKFYQGQAFYPHTPSLGCLCTKELWSERDGRALVSDQLALVQAFLSTGIGKGYLYLVELDNKKEPVVLDEIIMDMLTAEEQMRE
jgi:hypothetical protein